jgi:hypothetical protein
LDQHAERWFEIPLRKFSAQTQRLVDKYDDGRIHMDFTFILSEENNFSSELSFLSTLRAGTDSLGLKASNNRTRKNTRNFRVKDSFAGLLTAGLTCSGEPDKPNYLYPITGEIGLKEVVWTFLDLNELQNLSMGEKGTNLFTDTVEFTTAIVGSASPKIVLNPVGKALRLANAGFTTEVKRDDQHQVLIGLSLPDDEGSKVTSAARAASTLLPSARLGVSTDRSIHTYQLDQLMNFQLEQNAFRKLSEPRTLNLSAFP